MGRHNLLVVSDVHLGNDLVHHARPDAPARGAASQRRDRELVALLDWYRHRPRGGLPWRLVIAGDFVDFTGMSVSGKADEIVTDSNAEERRHGLGSSVDHTLAKLRRVAEHHRAVFAALARFVDAGNTLVVVRGNHDVDLHWEPVKAAFRAILTEHAPLSKGSVEFADWFYYEEGLAYIEHGHQYDAYCSYNYLLHPVRASDPKRSDRSLSDVMLRYVVRPTRGMLESGHESASVLDYLRFGARLGILGLLGLGQRFLSATVALVALWREHVGGATRWVKKEHERKMALLAEALQISVIKLQALASLQRPPITRSLLRVLAGVMLDRIAFAIAGVIAVVWVCVARWTPALGVGVSVAVALLVPLAWLWRRARGAIDPSEALREGAARVAALFPAAFVVMGHTHLPEIAQSPDGTATYINLGAWAEEETPDRAPGSTPSRTHLVVEHADQGPRGLLLRWIAEQGPEHFVAARNA